MNKAWAISLLIFCFGSSAVAQIRVTPTDGGMVLTSDVALPQTITLQSRDIVKTVVEPRGKSRVEVPLVLLRSPASVRVEGQVVSVEGSIAKGVQVDAKLFENESVRTALNGSATRNKRLWVFLVVGALLLACGTLPLRWRLGSVAIVTAASIAIVGWLVVSRAAIDISPTTIDGTTYDITRAIRPATIDLKDADWVVSSLNILSEGVEWRVDETGQGRFILAMYAGQSAVTIRRDDR
jgi:hypothetical protein